MKKYFLLFSLALLPLASHAQGASAIDKCAWSWHSQFSLSKNLRVSYVLENGVEKHNEFCELVSAPIYSRGAGDVNVITWDFRCIGGQSGYLSKIQSGLGKMFWRWEVMLKAYPDTNMTVCRW